MELSTQILGKIAAARFLGCSMACSETLRYGKCGIEGSSPSSLHSPEPNEEIIVKLGEFVMPQCVELRTKESDRTIPSPSEMFALHCSDPIDSIAGASCRLDISEPAHSSGPRHQSGGGIPLIRLALRSIRSAHIPAYPGHNIRVSIELDTQGCS